ncbi:ABC transporter ATP-binding protein [Xanthobacter sp. DSM 24535]|uniref:ABC transporter ATP-binding protein n=1 Tax=Roseixanthobacter psychrophilus TaxID=3119917 RepID=UPI0037289016
MSELLRVENLTTWLTTRSGVVAAVDDVSFSVRAGETLALVGESGSGKSMTCLSVMQLLPASGRVAGGSIRLDGDDLLRKPAKAMQSVRGSQIGMVLQDPMTSLNPLYTVEEQIGEVFRYRMGIRDRAERRRRVIEVLKQVRIPAPEERMFAYPHQLSGGMRQRVAIAINLACSPRLLIADEPTTALDITVQQQILSLLRELQRETNMAIILVTHDLHAVERFCDSVAIMYAGRIVEQGPVAAVFERPAHPYTEGLLRALPRLGQDRERLALIPGQPPALADLPPGCRFAPRCAYADDTCRAQYPEWFATVSPPRRVACWRAPERLA